MDNWALFCTIFLVTLRLALADDYYTVLGVSKDADNREIRKAYKKLALLYHPDKNKGNEEIQEKFMKLNKAYEVLKDSDSRRKYDQFGEAGLDDSGSNGFHYQSWSYYENFGIYDDDPEIITLSDSDFSQSVQGRSDTWFINFYSTMCSHCHQMAPMWRKVATELVDVIRIGAVNCGEEYGLCRQQNIHSYPTLKLYPKELKFNGHRTTEGLVEFVLNSISAQYIHLTENNLETYLRDAKISKLAWLVFVCIDTSDCPTETTKLKLSVMLKGMVNVASIDHDFDFAKSISDESGAIFFEAGQLKKGFGQKIDENDAQEIFQRILKGLPEIEERNARSLKIMTNDLESENSLPHLLCFYSEQEELSSNLKQLPFLLDGVGVSGINCDNSRGICNELHIVKHPAFVVLKLNGKYEVYHGRVSARDVMAFVEDSLTSTVESLGPDDFPNRVIHSGEPWFVDFYAPWCPPCLRLLPEWRKASQHIGDIIHFGTVDCTIHHALCTQYKINSYPTTVLYNQTVPHKYVGERNYMDIVQFVEDTLSPSVISLTSATFEKSVWQRSTDEIWVVDFFAPWCGPCQQLSVHWKKLGKLLLNDKNVHVAQVDCTAQSSLCDKERIHAYPTIRLYPTQRQEFVTYDSYNRDTSSLRAWVYKFLPSHVQELDNNEFYNRVIYSTDRWIIDFYVPWCQHCEHFSPEFERVAQEFGDKVKTAKVNCDILQYVCNDVGIRAYPTVKFYMGSSHDNWPQSMQGIDVPGLKAEHIVQFVKDHISALKRSENHAGHDEL